MVEFHEEGSGSVPTLAIIVDGIDLIELVRRTEQPFAEAEGSPSIAGQYRGIWIDYVAPPSKHLYGDPSQPVYLDGDKVQVLECECGEPGCWPLMCRITVGSDRVTWSDFEQPHRRGKPTQAAWQYDRLGRLEFDRVEYENAVNGIRRSHDR